MRSVAAWLLFKPGVHIVGAAIATKGLQTPDDNGVAALRRPLLEAAEGDLKLG